MSAEAAGHVYRHSPYRGAVFQVHLAIGDTVSDQNGNEFWMSQPKTAVKARVSERAVREALSTLEHDGWTERLAEQHGRHKGTTYRFVFREDQPVIFDSRTPAAGSGVKCPTPATPSTTPAESDANPGRRADPDLLPTQRNPTDPNSDVQKLCAYFQRGMESYHGTKPKITAQWSKDMDLLVRRGPVSWDKEKAIPAAEVAHVIHGLFTELTIANGGGDFCWAKVTRSPTKLRLHWDEITAALKKAERTPRRVSHQNDQDARTNTELYADILRAEAMEGSST